MCIVLTVVDMTWPFLLQVLVVVLTLMVPRGTPFIVKRFFLVAALGMRECCERVVRWQVSTTPHHNYLQSFMGAR